MKCILCTYGSCQWSGNNSLDAFNFLSKNRYNLEVLKRRSNFFYDFLLHLGILHEHFNGFFYLDTCANEMYTDVYLYIFFPIESIDIRIQ